MRSLPIHSGVIIECAPRRKTMQVLLQHRVTWVHRASVKWRFRWRFAKTTAEQIISRWNWLILDTVASFPDCVAGVHFLAHNQKHAFWWNFFAHRLIFFISLLLFGMRAFWTHVLCGGPLAHTLNRTHCSYMHQLIKDYMTNAREGLISTFSCEIKVPCPKLFVMGTYV